MHGMDGVLELEGILREGRPLDDTQMIKRMTLRIS